MLSSNFSWTHRNSNCCRGKSIIPASAIRSCVSEEREAQVSAAVYKKGPVKAGTKIWAPPHELFIPPLGLQGRSVGSDEEPRGLPKSCAWLGWNFLEINGNLIKLFGVEMEERPRKSEGARDRRKEKLHLQDRQTLFIHVLTWRLLSNSVTGIPANKNGLLKHTNW